MITPPVGVNNSSYIGYMWPNNNKAAIEFRVPSFPYKQPLSASEKANHTVLAIWAGLGSPSSPDIEQIGIYDVVINGKVHWQCVDAFWPASDEDCPGSGLISTGDEIFANVTRTSGYNYTMAIKDAGPHHRWTWKVSRYYPHIEGSAEAIAEDTQYPGFNWEPLTKFSPFNVFTSGNPRQEWNISSWGYAVKDSSREITIHG